MARLGKVHKINPVKGSHRIGIQERPAMLFRDPGIKPRQGGGFFMVFHVFLPTDPAIEINSKSTEGGWKDSLAGMKEWSIDNDGLWVASDNAHKALATAFKTGNPVCVKVYNGKTNTGMFGGLAVITDYPIEAPYDDAVTYSITLTGKGALVDFSIDPPQTDTMPA